MSPSKPTVHIRRPHRVTPEAIERFVQEAPELTVLPPTPGRPDVQASERPDASTSGGERRRTTIYFQPETIKALKLRAVEEDLQMSELVDEAVRSWLERRASGKR